MPKHILFVALPTPSSEEDLRSTLFPAGVWPGGCSDKKQPYTAKQAAEYLWSHWPEKTAEPQEIKDLAREHWQNFLLQFIDGEYATVEEYEAKVKEREPDRDVAAFVGGIHEEEANDFLKFVSKMGAKAGIYRFDFVLDDSTPDLVRQLATGDPFRIWPVFGIEVAE